MRLAAPTAKAPAATAAEPDAAAQARATRRRRLARLAGLAASVILFAVALLVLGRTLTTISFASRVCGVARSRRATS